MYPVQTILITTAACPIPKFKINKPQAWSQLKSLLGEFVLLQVAENK